MDEKSEKRRKREEHERAKHLVTHDPAEPTWMYRLNGDEMQSRVFPAAEIPDGWYDSPANIPKEPVGIVAETDGKQITPKRRGRPRKVRDGDGA